MDTDGDGAGNACDTDDDNDGIPDDTDDCPLSAANYAPGTPEFAAECVSDVDGDGRTDDNDNCTSVANPLQTNTDGDAFGDACDTDLDNDGILNNLDNCPETANPDQTDTDFDGIGDAFDGGATGCDARFCRVVFIDENGPSQDEAHCLDPDLAPRCLVRSAMNVNETGENIGLRIFCNSLTPVGVLVRSTVSPAVDWISSPNAAVEADIMTGAVFATISARQTGLHIITAIAEFVEPNPAFLNVTSSTSTLSIDFAKGPNADGGGCAVSSTSTGASGLAILLFLTGGIVLFRRRKRA